jgi:DNA-binding NtrC family response regulator
MGSALREKRVLVVDDDPDVLRTIVHMLDQYAEVRLAFGADEALRVLDADEIDAVIVDFNMKGPDGAWLLRQVRDRYPEVARILLSGSSYVELCGRLEPGLVDSFIAKPFEAEDIIDCVD